jgi:hypothetical protein
MNKFSHCAAVVAVFFLSPVATNAEPASSDSIKALMRLTGSSEMGMQMMSQMVPALKKTMPDAPESFWSDVMSEINTHEIEDLIIPVYQKHLTESDIQSINSFYQTEAGKNLIKVQPAIMQESMAIGQQWGQKIAKQVLHKYQESNSNKP